MSTTDMPKNADDWGKFLAEKSLPSPFRVGKLVLNAMQKKDLSYAAMADQLNSDPILSYYIMSKANEERPGSNPTSKTLDHAISMIGVDSLERIIKKLPFQDSSSEDIKAFYFVRTLSTSLYAAHLGRAICKAKNVGHEEDIFWSSLFLGVPIWTMWRFATPEMRLVRYAIRNNFKLPPVAEREVLGCTLLEASTAMVQEIGLSDLVKDCYNPKYQLSHKQWISIAKLMDKDGNFKGASDDRDLLMIMQSPQFMIQLANMIAHYATHDWYSRACLRSQRILAAFLKVPLHEAIKITHEAAAEMSRAHPLPGVMLPASKLFLDPRKRVKATGKQEESIAPNQTEQAAAAATPAPKPAPAADEAVSSQAQTIVAPAPEPSETAASTPKGTVERGEPVEAPKKSAPEPSEPAPEPQKAATEESPVFKELTDIMQLRPHEFTDLHELMNAATQGLAYGLHMKHTAVSLINKDSTRLKTYYSVGCRENSELATFDTPIIKNTIFQKLAEKPASLWVKATTSEKIANLIPMNFKQVVQVDEFLLMSVFVGKRPVAIFYADNDSAGITEHQYTRFKFMCGAVSNALLHQANAKKRKLKK